MVLKMQISQLRYAQITDLCSISHQEGSSRIVGFYKLAPVDIQIGLISIAERPRMHLKYCLPDDPDLELISLIHHARPYRPWDLTWVGSVGWYPHRIQIERDSYEQDIKDYGLAKSAASMSAAEVESAFPPLSHHNRLRVYAWQNKTHQLILASKTTEKPPSIKQCNLSPGMLQ